MTYETLKQHIQAILENNTLLPASSGDTVTLNHGKVYISYRAYFNSERVRQYDIPDEYRISNVYLQDVEIEVNDVDFCDEYHIQIGELEQELPGLIHEAISNFI
jgi:hypothetical protein